MALFKINRGSKDGLKKNKPNIKDGNAYFTTDDGKFYIDVAGEGETEKTAAIYGNTTEHPNISGANRICINPISQTDFNNLDTKIDNSVTNLTTTITNVASSKADDFTILNCGDSNC